MKSDISLGCPYYPCGTWILLLCVVCDLKMLILVRCVYNLKSPTATSSLTIKLFFTSLTGVPVFAVQSSSSSFTDLIPKLGSNHNLGCLEMLNFHCSTEDSTLYLTVGEKGEMLSHWFCDNIQSYVPNSNSPQHIHVKLEARK